MKPSRTLYAAVAAAALVLAMPPVHAAPRCQGPGSRMGAMADPAAAQSRLAALKAQLAISPQQEGAWQNYAVRVMEQVQRRQTQMQTRPCINLAPADHAACRDAMWQARSAERQGVMDAANALRSQLSPEQNALFNSGWGMRSGRSPGMGAMRW